MFTVVPIIAGSHIYNHLVIYEQLKIRENNKSKYNVDIDEISRWKQECPLWKQWCTLPDIDLIAESK